MSAKEITKALATVATLATFVCGCYIGKAEFKTRLSA